MRKLLLLALALSILLAMMVIASSPLSVHAIDPTLDAAISAIAHATAQEQERRNAISATSAALSAQATSVAVEATRQAGYARSTTQAQEMNDMGTRRAADATATQQTRDAAAMATRQAESANATATANAQSALATQAYNSALSTRQSGDATATVSAMYTNATATVVSMGVQATAEFISQQQRDNTRNGVMLTAAICVGLFIAVFVGWRMIQYFRQAQDTMASHVVRTEPIKVMEGVIEPARPLELDDEAVIPETIVVNDPDAATKWATILGANQ